jgi:hypothetical protein
MTAWCVCLMLESQPGRFVVDALPKLIGIDGAVGRR